MSVSRTVAGVECGQYIPESDSILLTVGSIPINANNIDMLPAAMLTNKHANHETAHHLLARHTRYGYTVRTIGSVVTGLVEIIHRRMSEKHGRLFTTFSEYETLPDADVNTVDLIRVTYRLHEFQKRMIKNWQITHEVFAFIVEAYSCGVMALVSKSLFGCIPEEIIETFSPLQDPRFLEVLEKRGLADYEEQQKLGLESDWKLKYLRLADEYRNIEPQWAITLERLAHFDAKRDPVIEHQDLNRMFIGRTKEEYLRGLRSHKEAVKVISSIDPTIESVALTAGVCMLLSTLYAPRLNPKVLLEKGIAAFDISRGPDHALLRAIQHATALYKNDIWRTNNSVLIAEIVKETQSDLGSPTFDEFKYIPTKDVLGSEEWFAELLKHISVKAKERRHLSRLCRVFAEAEPSLELRPFPRLSLSYNNLRVGRIPFVIRNLLRVFFSQRRLVLKQAYSS